MNRMYSILTVKAVEDEQRIIRGTATTPAPDRVGDTIQSMGVQFNNPMPLLRQHDHNFPVGTVTFDKPTKDGITFVATLPKISEPGPLRDRVDTAWGEVVEGLVRAVSIGFRPLEYSFIDAGGIDFKKCEVIELSLVTIPCNPDAQISAIKSFDLETLAAKGKAPNDDDRPVNPANISAKADDTAAIGKNVHVARLNTKARDRAEPFVVRTIHPAREKQ